MRITHTASCISARGRGGGRACTLSARYFLGFWLMVPRAQAACTRGPLATLKRCKNPPLNAASVHTLLLPFGRDSPGRWYDARVRYLCTRSLQQAIIITRTSLADERERERHSFRKYRWERRRPEGFTIAISSLSPLSFRVNCLSYCN